ncbi:hypothetical protein FHS55_002081 [Angulomicrobium tetraedrale]|uniref:Uncharacterized protein n=1 Tax=Ancylobacter tetraedralis TaxID=217068 RepID=A0A839Z9S3_9HYPH|nr:hypothetical protein [Ancylobacter tetraedralis]
MNAIITADAEAPAVITTVDEVIAALGGNTSAV